MVSGLWFRIQPDCQGCRKGGKEGRRKGGKEGRREGGKEGRREEEGGWEKGVSQREREDEQNDCLINK